MYKRRDQERPVAGQITRPKRIKRQGYGRHGLDTIERRFIHAA